MGATRQASRRFFMPSGASRGRYEESGVVVGLRFVRFATAGRGRGRSVSQSYRRLIACASTVRWRATTSTRALDGWVEVELRVSGSHIAEQSPRSDGASALRPQERLERKETFLVDTTIFNHPPTCGLTRNGRKRFHLGFHET